MYWKKVKIFDVQTKAAASPLLAVDCGDPMLRIQVPAPKWEIDEWSKSDAIYLRCLKCHSNDMHVNTTSSVVNHGTEVYMFIAMVLRRRSRAIIPANRRLACAAKTIVPWRRRMLLD